MTPEAAAEWSKEDLHKKLQTALSRNIELAIENERLKIAGHKSRDPEVERLVDILRNLVDAIEDYKMRISFNHVWKYTEAKEALKQYQK